jgi:hypothetical protein
VKIKLESTHPISNPRGWESWDGKEHEVESYDLTTIGKLVARVAFKPWYAAGYSRIIDGVPHYFPRRYTTGVHCIRAVKC